MMNRMMMAQALRGGMGGAGQPNTAGQLNSTLGGGSFFSRQQPMGFSERIQAGWQQPQMMGGNLGHTAQGLFGQGMATLGQMRPDLNLSGAQGGPMGMDMGQLLSRAGLGGQGGSAPMGAAPAAQPEAQPVNPRAAFFGRLMQGIRDRAQS
jgi:hypothetical protein